MSKRKLSMDEKRVRMKELFAESVNTTTTTTTTSNFTLGTFL